MPQTPQAPAPETRSSAEERQYLLRRAGDHRRLADGGAETDARAIHLRMAQLYEQQAALLDVVFPD